MIVITGAAGFIGSALVAKLNEEGFFDLVLVDDFKSERYTSKAKNLEGKRFSEKVDRTEFFPWLDGNEDLVQFIFHLGARTDTAEMDQRIFDELNLEYSKTMWQRCVECALPLVYASSAATYGGGEHGYKDSHDIVSNLKPLNPYGESKNDFDRWALEQEKKPFFWAGAKFFNVYGPNEYHKGRMASVVFHAFNQINEKDKVKLFRSHRDDYRDGQQLRDFIYVKDVVEVLYFFMHHRKDSGLYNLGTGKADSFLELARSTFEALGKEPNIEFIDTPEDIRDKYQYFTEADMSKLISIGYERPFASLRDGVKDYVQEYLKESRSY